MITTAVIVGIFLIFVAALLGYAATKPNTFCVQRTASINAPAEKIFTLISDFRRWLSWSPWEKLDPQLKRTYSGPADGRGAVYEWEGNKKVGTGRMEITEAALPSKIQIKLDFLKPFEAHNTAEFTLETRGNSTNVTWVMHGRQPFLFKVMTTFLNMEKMIGKDFETGLANLKNITEKAA